MNLLTQEEWDKLTEKEKEHLTKFNLARLMTKEESRIKIHKNKLRREFDLE